MQTCGSNRCLGCGRSAVDRVRSKKPSEQEVTASLPELPQADLAKLKQVPRTQILATSEVQLPAPAPPESESAVHPNCAADASEIDYSAEVNYPITVCNPPNGVPVGTIPGPSAPTHKLDSSKLSAEQKAVAGQSATAQLWWCHQHNGPWQAYLSSVRGCSGVCGPQNVLTLTNAPNLVTFHWAGSPGEVPPGAPFTYASKPAALGPPIDEGRCHAQN